MQIKDPIIFLTGSLIGAGITFLVTKSMLEKKVEQKYEKQYQEELKSVKESFAYLAEKDKERAEAAKNKPPLVDCVKAAETVREKESAEVAKKEKVNYSNIAVELEKEEVEDDAETPLIDTSLIDEDTDTSGPYILKRWPTSAESEYTQLEITYYSDGTYADSRDTEMEIEEYIGKKMMDYVENTDKDEIFIRNDDLALDIDITKDNRTYDEVMFG